MPHSYSRRQNNRQAAIGVIVSLGYIVILFGAGVYLAYASSHYHLSIPKVVDVLGVALPFLGAIVVHFLCSPTAERARDEFWGKRASVPESPTTARFLLPGIGEGRDEEEEGISSRGVVISESGGREGPVQAAAAIKHRGGRVKRAGRRIASAVRVYGITGLPFVLAAVFTTVINGAAYPYMFTPSAQTCMLSGTWQTLFKNKDADAIRTLQDSFGCCGLRSSRDMAWPFPSAQDGTTSQSCEQMFGRTEACLPAWERMDSRVRLSWAVHAVAIACWCLFVASMRAQWARREAVELGQFGAEGVVDGRPDELVREEGPDGEAGGAGPRRLVYQDDFDQPGAGKRSSSDNSSRAKATPGGDLLDI